MMPAQPAGSSGRSADPGHSASPVTGTIGMQTGLTHAQIGAAVRTFAVLLGVVAALSAVAGKLVLLALAGQSTVRFAAAEPLTTSFSRPDIVDAQGRLLASDIAVHSIVANPSLIFYPDDTVEKLASVLPDLDVASLRAALAQRDRRFAWVRRGVSPALAQTVHELGLPGIGFKIEPRRGYARATLAGHLLGHVNVDNKGMAGLETWIDAAGGVEASHGVRPSLAPPVRLTLDMAAQQALEHELGLAMSKYRATAASGVILDADSGAIAAAASLPLVDPGFPERTLAAGIRDHLMGGAYELGSIFKTFTVAMALEAGTATPAKRYDVSQPLQIGRRMIKDAHGTGQPLSVSEILVHSSNVGAGLLALEVGTEGQRDFLSKLGLLGPMQTEAGPIAAPIKPKFWGRAETITIAYGHGLAVSPMQVAAAASALVNGGYAVTPHLVERPLPPDVMRKRVISEQTSLALRAMLRRNVVDPAGTGRKADVAGYRVGGKTGTADRAVDGGYAQRSVISSFLAAFPIDKPRFIVLVTLHEPKAIPETRGLRTAAVNAAPTTARIIARVAPVLGVYPGT